MGMHFKTAYNHRDRAISACKDLASRAQIYGMRSSAISDDYKAILDSIDKCPQWVKQYVRGWFECARESWRLKLVFFYTMPDGSLLSTHRNRDDYYEKCGLGPREVYEQATHSGHYWVMPNGTKRPHFVSKMK